MNRNPFDLLEGVHDDAEDEWQEVKKPGKKQLKQAAAAEAAAAAASSRQAAAAPKPGTGASSSRGGASAATTSSTRLIHQPPPTRPPPQQADGPSRPRAQNAEEGGKRHMPRPEHYYREFMVGRACVA